MRTPTHIVYCLFGLLGTALWFTPASGQDATSFGDQDVQHIKGAPVAIYTSVARAIRACWFNQGPLLRNSHLFRAKVMPAAKGGAAEISVFTKGPDGKRAHLALGIVIETEGHGSKILQKNRLFSEPQSRRMRQDVLRWARHDLACGAALKVDAAAVNIPLPVKHPKRRNKKRGGANR